MAWTITALRRLRVDLAPTVGLLVLVLVTALVAALAPRVLASLADEAVRADVLAAPAAARNIVVQRRQWIGTGPEGDPLSVARAAGESIETTFPDRVRELIADRDLVVESGRFRLLTPTTDPAFVRLRIQPGIGDHLRYVQGRAPTGTVGARDDVGPEAQDGVPVYEAGVSTETARRFGLELGDTVPLEGDPGDPLIGRTPQAVYAFATITGIYDVLDPVSDFWLDDPLPIHPVIRALSSEVQLLDAALLLDDSAHGSLAAAVRAVNRPLLYTWRSFLDGGGITARSTPALVADLRRLEVLYPSANITVGSDTGLRTGLLAILESHQAAWAAAESMFAVTAIGPALVAIATLALVAVLASRRRRATMALARGRGASGLQVTGPAAVEGLLIALPAGIAAMVAAVALVADDQAGPMVAAVAVVVAAAVAMVVATVAPIARSTGPDRRPGDRVAGDVRGRRLALEGMVVVLAVGAAFLLRERGIGGIGATDGTGGFDPLIAAVPALVGVAAGIVAMRAYPVVMRFVARQARRRRGLVPMLAARRSTEGGAGSAVMLVLLATATVGAFGAASLDSLDRGSELAAWQETGAGYRVDPLAGALPYALDPAALPGVEAAATSFEGAASLRLNGPQTLVAVIEAGPLREVLAGTPVEPVYPDGFAQPGPGPIPVIISRALAESARGVELGETFKMSIEGYELEYRADAIVDSFPGLPADRGFMVAARERFKALAPEARIVPVAAFLRAPPGAAASIRAAVDAISPTLSVASQAEDATARRTAPVTGAVRALIIAALLVTAAYAALGVSAALALAGIARVLEVAHLRTLGMTGRQSFNLLAAEHGPTTLVAFVAGGLLGVALFALLRPAIGLGILVGAPVEVPVVLDPVALTLILIMMLAVLGLGLVLGSALQRRVAPTAALRGRFE